MAGTGGPGVPTAVVFAAEAFVMGCRGCASAFARFARLFLIHGEEPRLRRLCATRPLLGVRLTLCGKREGRIPGER